jgi:hypothetical protein
VGGGIAGMQAALELANAAYYVHPVEQQPHRQRHGAVGQDLPHQRLRHILVNTSQLTKPGNVVPGGLYPLSRCPLVAQRSRLGNDLILHKVLWENYGACKDELLSTWRMVTFTH